MNAPLTELYRELILDHSRTPRNFRRLDPPCCQVEGANPLCGDKLTLYLRSDDERIVDIAFEGSGCAISLASASMMTEAVTGRPVAEAQALFRQMQQLLAGEGGQQDRLGKLASLGGVRAFPSRVKCATLAWRALEQALSDNTAPVSTESGDR